MPFDRTDLFRQTGYEEGDVVPLSDIATSAGASLGFASTTSTTFIAQSAYQGRPDWSAWGPSDRIRFRFFARADPGTDETYSIRLNDTDNGTELVRIDNITAGGNVDSGWDAPATLPTGQNRVILQHKTDPGNNSSDSFAINILVGVEL